MYLERKLRTLKFKSSVVGWAGDVAWMRTRTIRTRELDDGTTIKPVHYREGEDRPMAGLLEVPRGLRHPDGHMARFPEGAIVFVVSGVLQFGEERYEPGWIIWVPPNSHYMPLMDAARFDCKLIAFLPRPPEVVTLAAQQRLIPFSHQGER